MIIGKKKKKKKNFFFSFTESTKMATHTLSKIITLKFSGPIPSPMPAVTAPTPGEDYERYLAEQQAKNEATQQLANEQNREIKEATSMMGKLSSMGKAALTQVNDGASKAHTSMEGAARRQLDTRSLQQFKESFPHMVCDYLFLLIYYHTIGSQQ